MAHDYKNYPELTNKQLETEGFSSPHPQYTEDFEATVVKVHDGDTVTLETEDRDFTFPLRLLEIDAPEMNNGGEEARDWLRGFILDEEVEVKIDPYNRVGKYGRLLGKIVSRGLDVGDAEIRLGYAKPFGQKLESTIPTLKKLWSKKWF